MTLRFLDALGVGLVSGRVVLRSTRPESGGLVCLGLCCRTGLHPSHTTTTTRVGWGLGGGGWLGGGWDGVGGVGLIMRNDFSCF